MDLLSIQTVLKRLLSYRKRDWVLGDYPIRVRENQPWPGIENGDFRFIAWTAQTINWPTMVGLGDSRKEALSSLAETFARYRDSGETLPRPGTKVPVRFAPRDEITDFEDLAVDFFARVLELNYYECFVSDQASMFGFYDGESNEILFQRIEEVYETDVSDIESGNLVEIFQRLRILGSRLS